MGRNTKLARGRKNTAQTSPIPGREAQMMKNAAGGYVFKADWHTVLDRILILGTDSGTYYVNPQRFFNENDKAMSAIFKEHGEQAVARIVEVRQQNLAPKIDNLIFWAAQATNPEYPDKVRRAAWNSAHQLCKTASHLFSFLESARTVHGWNRSMRQMVSDWYNSRIPEVLGYQMTKYRQRANFTHRKALLLAHVKPISEEHNLLYRWAVGKTGNEEVPDAVRRFTMFQNAEDVGEVCELIREYGHVPKEWLKDEHAKHPAVMQALLPELGTTAMLRQVGLMTSKGINPELIAERLWETLSAEDYTSTTGLHPFNVLLAFLVYDSGGGHRSDWTPNRLVNEVFQKGLEYAFETRGTLEKRVLVAVDSSGSMSGPVGLGGLSQYVVARAIAYYVARAFNASEVINFDTSIHHGDRMDNPKVGLKKFINRNFNGGGTDCSLPLEYAKGRGFDAVVSISDYETWAGDRHALTLYEELVAENPNIKVVNIALNGTRGGNLLPGNPNVLEVVGFDGTVVPLVQDFLEGKFSDQKLLTNG